MTKAGKKISMLLILVILAAAGYWGYKKLSPAPAPNYVTEKVRRGNIENTVLANGMLQASKLVNVGAQVSGQILNLPVKLGDQIKQGDLIAQIDSLTQQNNLKEAEASLANINAQYVAKQAQIKQATYEYKRQKGMLSAHASSQADFENAESTLAVYKAELKQLTAQKQQAKIQVDTANIDLGYTTILAPMDGTVVYTAVEAGQTVNANQTTPTIIELAKLDTMTIKAQISEADVIHTKAGQEAYFSILGQPNQKYHSVLTSIEPGPTIMTGDDSNLTASDSDAIYYNGLFNVDNDNFVLRIGMTAEVSIVLNQAENVILVPSQILRRVPRKTDKFQVPVLENGKVIYKEVTVGINNKVKAEILTGLKEGDEIIVGMPDSSLANTRGPRMRI